MSYFRRLGSALFGRPEAKASAVGNLIARVMVGMPVWPKRDFEQLGREAYQQNPIVARSVKLIAESVASIPFELHKGRGQKRQVMEDHPLLDLLRAPNPMDDQEAFITSVVSHLLISGNAYVERTNEDRLDRMELYSHRPDRIQVVPGPQGVPMAYEYRAGGDRRRFDVDPDRGVRPLLHLRKFHPVDDWYGMSPLDPAAWSIDAHNAAGAWNKGLLDNSATPSGAFVYSGNADGGNRLSNEQFDRMNAQIREMIGSRKAGMPLLLEGGVDWKSMSVDPDKMQFVDAKHMAAREIALAIGVPPMLLGIPGDNTYSNYAEANRAFYRQTVIPMAKWIARALTHWFEPQLKAAERLVVDVESLDAMREERLVLWEKLDKLTFLSINERREIAGFENVAPAADVADQVYVSAALLPINAGDLGAIAGGAAPADEQQSSRGSTGARGRLN